MRLRRRIRMRWALPAGALVVAGGVLAGTVLASAAGPALPGQTPAQLLAAMAQAKLPAAMSATISQSANLGFPALPDIGGMSSSPLSAASLIAGSHTVQVWYAGPTHLRVALPVSFGETDLRLNKTQVWLWNSQGQKATHLILPPSHNIPAPPKRSDPGISDTPVPPTPMQAAKRLLALVGPSTRVTVPGTTVVAGRDAYQLAIAPRSNQSLVGRIMIAVDAKNHLPLSVQVFARGASSPAFQTAFTSLSLAKPAMSNFTFMPPPGAKVRTVRLPAATPPVGPKPEVPGPFGHGPFGAEPFGAGPLADAQTFGQGWLSVVAVPVGEPNHATYGKAGFEPSGSARGPGPFAGIPGEGPALFGVLLKAATPVHGLWGSGRLLRTSLFSVLLTSKGELLAGAVTPAVLYADAAKIK